MYTHRRPAPASARHSEAGLLKGCLLGCLIPVMIVVVILLIARPALQEKWKTFRADNPWTAQVPGAAAVLKDVAGGFGGEKDTANPDTARARRSAQPLKGVNDKAAMPSDLPLWPRPKTETFSAGKDQAAAYQRVRQTADSVLRYFRRSMPAKGWRLDQERTGAGGTLLLYRKSKRIARVEVVSDSAGTDIWLRSRTVVPPPQR